MNLLRQAAFLLCSVIIVAGVLMPACAAASKDGPGDVVIPQPAMETVGILENVPVGDFRIPAGTAPGMVFSLDHTRAGLSETGSPLETALGRYFSGTLVPYPNSTGIGSHPAVISRSPMKVDLFYWACNANGCPLNTTAKLLGDTNPEYALESPIVPAVDHRYSPAVYSMNATHLGVFFVGNSRSLYQTQWTQANGWSDFANYSQPVFPYCNAGSTEGCSASTPGAVSRYNGNMELVYVENSTNQLVHHSFNSGYWAGGEYITNPGSVTEDGASVISLSPDSFDVLIHYANTVWIRHWNQSIGWDNWRDTGRPSFSYVGASTRTFSDATVSQKWIDIITNTSSSAGAYYNWSVSGDGGLTWYSEPFTSGGTGFIINGGSPFVGVAPNYNRIEFYQEWGGRIWKEGWAEPSFERIGVFRNSTHTFYLDYNGNGGWSGPATDRSYNFGITGDIPITGDWNNNGITKIGVFRPSTHLFYLDYNGNGAWSGPATDRSYNFGITGDIPVTGDWNHNGITEIGVFRPSTHLFYLDYNGNGAWNGAGPDRSRNFGITGDIPITGDWNIDGITEIGVFRPSTHLFYLDYNGNGAWDGVVTDRSYNFGITGDIPVTGDWNGDGRTKIGVFRPSTHMLYLDYDGTGTWNGAVIDWLINFGIAEDKPISGGWK